MHLNPRPNHCYLHSIKSHPGTTVSAKWVPRNRVTQSWQRPKAFHPAMLNFTGGAPQASWAHAAPGMPGRAGLSRRGLRGLEQTHPWPLLQLGPRGSGRLELAPLYPALQNRGGTFVLLLSQGPEEAT